jgi:hypothetical protein
MFHFKLRAALVALTAIAALALPASAVATNVTTWQIVQQNDPGASNTDLAPYADVPTDLVSPPIIQVGLPYGAQSNPNAAPQSLVYGYEIFGVNLRFTTSPTYQWEFRRQPGTYATQQIPASERVALYNTAIRKYLAWACPGGNTGCTGIPIEANGINLYWSTTASYEWQVFKGGNPATPSYADLYDSIEGAYLIPWSNPIEVGLGWIHAPFETGPDYIPPGPPVSTSQQPVSGSPLPAK